jgi:hypothetical protein
MYGALVRVAGSLTTGDVVRKSLWLWVLVIFLAILVLALIFGGYRKGTKLGVPAEPRPAAAWTLGRTA